MRLLSWNVQWCRGIDGRVDPRRIAAEAKRLADPDVLCLQEIAVDFPEMEGSSGENQVEDLKKHLQGYEAFFAPAVDLPGRSGRRQFGNLVMSRLPVGRVLRHPLPWPAAPQVQSMPRAVVEVVVEAPFGALRVMTTHLEYYSKDHRGAQIERLRELHLEACSEHLPVDQPGSYESHERGIHAIACGDFNLKPEDPHHRRMLDAGFVDAWQALNPGKPRQATFHLHDGEPPYCCDYVFVTPDLVPRLRSIRIDTATQASDHQPVVVELA
ncbi:MAG: endonuclease/exonuclease/phosphatase family protein [Burkholderiales bacterium]